MSSFQTDAYNATLVEQRSALARATKSKAQRGHALGSMLFWAASLEFVVVTAIGYLCVALYHMIIGVPPASVDQPKYLASSLMLAGAILVASVALRHFQQVQTRPLHMVVANGVLAVVLAFSFLLSTMFLLKLTDEYSRGAFLLQFVAIGVVVSVTRALLFLHVRAAVAAGQVEARRVVLVGEAGACGRLAERLQTNGVLPVALLSPPTTDAQNLQGSEESLLELVAACRATRAQDILLLSGAQDWLSSSHLAHRLSDLPVGLHIVPPYEASFSTSEILEFGGVTTIKVARPPLSFVDRAIKRAFDICGSVLGLLLLAPLFLVVAIAIKIDTRGPVFFRQLRHGYNKDPIWVLKFRSMTVMENDSNFIRQAQKNDPRVTRIGRVLRRTNIDELPQLLNVLSGEMSLIGPRPHATAHDKIFEALIPPYSRRHRIKPGLSGWAQVNGFRGETDTLDKMQARIDFDLHYIENWSLWFDVKIVFLTLFSRKTFNNAY